MNTMKENLELTKKLLNSYLKEKLSEEKINPIIENFDFDESIPLTKDEIIEEVIIKGDITEIICHTTTLEELDITVSLITSECNNESDISYYEPLTFLIQNSETCELNYQKQI